MVTSLADAARGLWRQAPYWRMSVIGAAGFTILSLVYLWSGDDGTAPTAIRPVATTPPPPADPASDTRLADYEASYNAAAKLPAAGASCEQIAGAYEGLTSDDLKRGRNIVLSSASRLKALATGEVCRNNIAKSNQHFMTVAQAVTAATQPNATAQALQTAAEAPRALDAFDRSRPRYEAEGSVIGRAQAFAADLSASDNRIRAFVADADAYGSDPSALSALRAADTLGQLTPFDRGRLTGPQQSSLERAGEAARLVQESRTRLSRLGRLLTAAQGNAAPDARDKLIDGVAAVTPFDRAIATPDQKQMLEQASAKAIADAWSIARERVAGLGPDERLDRLQAAASVYDVLKNAPQDTLSPEQKQILAKAQRAVDALATSDARLHALNDAYAAWQQRGIAAGEAAVEAVRAITPLDRSRFGDAERKAMVALAKVDQIIRGPEIGFTAQTKDRLPIFVQPASDSALDSRLAVSLASALRRAGFTVTPVAADAALTLSIGFKGADGPKQDLSGGFFAWVITARANYMLSWVADGTTVVGGEVARSGRSQDQTAVQSQALLADIDAIVASIQAKAGP